MTDTPEQIERDRIRRQEIITRVMGDGRVPMHKVQHVASAILHFEKTGEAEQLADADFTHPGAAPAADADTDKG